MACVSSTKIKKACINDYLVINDTGFTFSEKELEQNSFEGKLLDIMLHDAYHTGQIIQLRKMQRVWPSNRKLNVLVIPLKGAIVE